MNLVVKQLNMIIKVHQVKVGDFYSILFKGDDGQPTRIFLDSGVPRSYKNILKPEINSIRESNSSIDLFIISHIDRDHIGGMKGFIKDFKAEDNIVKEFWLNWSTLSFKMPSKSTQVSVTDGIELRDFLLEKGLVRKNDITNQLEDQVLNGASLKIVSPDEKHLNKLKKKWADEEKKSYLHSSPSQAGARANDYKESIIDLYNRTFSPDTSIPNKSSIAFILSFRQHKILFLADSQPSVIIKYLKEIGRYSTSKPLEVDYMTVPHHGSAKNINNELMNLIRCQNFIISSDGTQRPHKESLARIINNEYRDVKKEIRFFFNYKSSKIKSIFSAEEKETYNFKCIYPKDDEKYIEIKLDNL